jgi:hypothetical protein
MRIVRMTFGLTLQKFTSNQVLIGPDDNDGHGPWYFSLNNRRLWVLKQCQRDGLLDDAPYDGTIAVRVRATRSEAERRRYTVDNCALEAKFTREGAEDGGGTKKGGRRKKDERTAMQQRDKNDATGSNNATSSHPVGNEHSEVATTVRSTNDGEDDSDSDSDDGVRHRNSFSALL